MRRHVPTAADLIRARCELAGLTVPQAARKAGLSKTTVYKRLSKGGWTLTELRQLDKAVHFDTDDFEVLLRGKVV